MIYDIIGRLYVLRTEIQEEIDSRPQQYNIGKLGCLKRVDKILEHYYKQTFSDK